VLQPTALPDEEKYGECTRDLLVGMGLGSRVAQARKGSRRPDTLKAQSGRAYTVLQAGSVEQ
jgi:hypothetical protein